MTFAIMSRINRPKYSFLLLAAVSLAVCVAATIILNRGSRPSILDADEQDYYILAGQLISGDYSFDVRRPPIHIAALAFMRLVTFDNLLATHVLAAAVFSLSAPLMYLLTRRLTGHNQMAVTVGILTIFWPPFLYYSSTLYSETTVLPLFIATLIAIPLGSVFRVDPPASHRRYLLPGILLGLCMLVRPMYLLFGPFAVALLFLEEPNWALATRRTIILTIGCLLIVLPWSAYISLRAGSPILVSANGGETLAGGLNPSLIEQGRKTFIAPNGREFWDGPGKWIPQDRTGYLNENETALPYTKRNFLLQQRTIEWIFLNPRLALHLEKAKLLYMWGFYPLFNTMEQFIFGNVPTIVLFIASILSLVKFRVHWRQLSRFWVLPIFVSVVALISWGSWRFRQPGDLGIIMLSVLFAWSIFENPSRLLRTAEPR